MDLTQSSRPATPGGMTNRTGRAAGGRCPLPAAIEEAWVRSARQLARTAPWFGAMALGAAPTIVPAAPQDPTVAAGQAQVAVNGNLTSISQQSQRAVIDWRSFNVGAGEAVDFRQPSASAVTLNRVLGNDLSAIYGRITANGTVFVVNPNGVLFGQGAQVNVGGLVATTANISNAHFMAGTDRFDQPGSATATVENQGVIRVADNGIAALVGRRVSNSGFIIARLGRVALAGGDAFVLDLAGDRLVGLVLDAGTLERVTDAQGQPLIARVDNTGSIQAAGGRVELTADTVSRLLNNVINVGGDIRAVAAEARDGVIRITGGASTDITFTGVVQAGGASASVGAAGRDITLSPSAQVDLTAGSDLNLTASRNVTLNAPLNALVPGATPGGGLNVVAANDLSVNETIALAEGPLSLSATLGRLTVADGRTLQAGNQIISLGGGAGLVAQSVLTSGTVSLSSANGTVEVRGTIGAPSTTTAAAAAGAVSVNGRNGVTLGGVRSAGVVDVQSTSGPITLNGAIDATGAVTMNAGASSLAVSAAGIRTTGVGSGIDLRAGGSLQLDGDLVANGATIALSSTGGTITARVASPGANPQAGDATLDAGADSANSRVDVRASGTVTLGGIVAHGGVTVRSDTGNVLMLSPLGGANTGYREYALGYQAGLRPDVGTLSIDAPAGSVELNGLNLDGLRNATDGGHGLRVVAGRMVLSNDIIAVNKGDILLQGGDTQATDGVYLGGNVFSRGFDQVVGGVRTKVGYGIRIAGRNLGVFDNTTGIAELPGLYQVNLSQAFVLNGQSFSRVWTDQEAYVVDENGRRIQVNGQFQRVAYECVPAGFCSPSTDPITVRVYAANDAALNLDRLVQGTGLRRTVAKIEIANNVANYQVDDAATPDVDERSALVAPTGTGAVPQVAIDVTSIGGVTNVVVPADGVGGARQSLATFQPVLGGLSQAAARVTPNTSSGAIASTLGVAIKVLGFEGANDAGTELWTTRLAEPLVAPTDPIGAQIPLQTDPNGAAQLFTAARGFDRTGRSYESPYELANGAFALPWTHVGPSNGRFQLSVQGNFRIANGGALPPGSTGCPGGSCMAVFTFELQADVARNSFLTPSRTARVVAVSVGGVSANWESVPTVVGVQPVGIGRIVSVFSRTPTIVSEPGRASGVQLVGSLLGGSPYSGAVTQGGAFRPSTPVDTPTPFWIQQANGTLRQNGAFVGGSRGYSFGRVTLESSSVPGAFGSDQRGTRVVLFDGILGNAFGGSTSDQSGSGVHLPGFSGIPGTNNSTTGFSSVGGTSGTVSGGQAQGGAAVGAAPAVPDLQPFEFRPERVEDRASQDALPSRDRVVDGQHGATGSSLQVGTGPTRQADLGRGGGLVGAAPNVFRRAYRLAVSGDASVCSPEAIEPPQGNAGVGASGERGSTASVRTCQPAAK